jgi:DNA-binding YbaB/EbfC family protein
MSFDMKSILEQVQKMKEEMERKRKELDVKTVTVETGGGMVQLTMTCNYRVKDLKITPDAVNANDIEMLQELVKGAFNQAVIEAGKAIESEMGSLQAMMPNMPGF